MKRYQASALLGNGETSRKMEGQALIFDHVAKRTVHYEHISQYESGAKFLERYKRMVHSVRVLARKWEKEEVLF